MPGTPGLRGQGMAQRLLIPSRPSMTGLGGLKGLPRSKALVMTQSPANLNASGYGYITTPMATITPPKTRRDEVFNGSWRLVAGAVGGTCLSPKSLSTQFNFQIGSSGSYPQTWRCDVLSNYGEAGFYDLSFLITRYDDPPAPLTGYGSPFGDTTIVPINPVTRLGLCSFSVSVSGGTPPYFYNWGGGDSPNSASNTASIYVPVGGSGVDFSPGCTITDSGSPQQSIIVGAGPFFVYEA